ncbi:MAG TPA: FtsX-like permease family protein [Prolixibacteraceae bacterium]
MWNTLKIFFRSLKRKKVKSIITIGGYAVSMAVLLILTTFIIGEKNVNTGFDRSGDIYRIIRSDNQALVPATLLNDVKEQVAGVEKMCLYTISGGAYKNKDQKKWISFNATEDDFLDLFSFKFIYQSSNPTLSIKSNIILTKGFSEKLYGPQNPVGKILDINDQPYTIVGVVNDVPKNASFSFDALLNIELANNQKMTSGEENHVLHNAFLRLNSKVDPAIVSQQISGLINHWQIFKDVKLSIEPLSKVYFNTLPNDNHQHANLHLIYLLSSIALVILLMTIFNYVNISISSGYERLNEIGIKKATGATRHDIFRQVLTESMFASLLAMILAVMIAFFIAPLFSDILDKKIDLQAVFSQPKIVLGEILIFLTTGILSGIYPAMAFSRVSPLQMMTHQKGFKRKGQRSGVIAVQFMITTVLIISLLFIQKQMLFVKHKDLGFDKEMMIKLNLGGTTSRNWEALKNELLANPEIISVSASGGTPMEIPSWYSNQYDVAGEKKMIEVKTFSVDESFVQTFGLKIIAGRNIEMTDSNACLINEHLYHQLAWDDLTGKEVMRMKVVGVVKDFHYENMYTEIGNLQLQQVNGYADYLNIKIRGDVSKDLKAIEKIYVKFVPESGMAYLFYDDWLQTMYHKEEKQASAIKVFSLLAIIISCLGLIGLIDQITNKKVKEIGIRKINGAKVSEVIGMLNKDIIKWGAVSFVISCPIGYYAMNKWLISFAYKTELSWWIFALAGLMALGIALLTVSWQSWKAATRNPVEALRYE